MRSIYILIIVLSMLLINTIGNAKIITNNSKITDLQIRGLEEILSIDHFYLESSTAKKINMFEDIDYLSLVDDLKGGLFDTISVLVIDMDGNQNSAQKMVSSLIDLSVDYQLATSIPSNLDLYRSIFLCLGTYSLNHVLTGSEGVALQNYLNNGGCLYMEGGDTWNYDSQTNVHPMFKINAPSDGTHDMSTVLGKSSTFTDGMSFNYSGDNNFMDHLNPISPAYLIFENSSPSYGTGVVYDAGTYRTIGTSHEFGGLDDGVSPSTRIELMQNYLLFFGVSGTIPPMSEISVSPISLDFGILEVGDTATMQFSITNEGEVTLVGSITTPNDFFVSNDGKNSLSYSVDTNSTKVFNLKFIPTLGQNYNDNVVISHNASGGDKFVSVTGSAVLVFSVPYSESFESNFGGWKQSLDDDKNWIRKTGPSSSYGTGPSSAYDDNYYLYTESYIHKKSGLYGLFSFENIENPQLSFWYNMHGQKMGELIVQISDDGGNIWHDVWSEEGEHGIAWYHAIVDLSNYANQSSIIIRFWSISGYSYTTDIAIDLVEVSNPIEAPKNLITSFDINTGKADLFWSFDGAPGFDCFNIYKDTILVSTTIDTTFSTVLSSFGVYNYRVTAKYNWCESDSTNLGRVNYYAVAPTNLSADINDSNGQVTLKWQPGGTNTNFDIHEDFEDGIANNWIPTSGYWGVSSNVYGVYSGSESKGGAYYNEDFTNYEYEVSMKITSTSTLRRAGIYFNGNPFFPISFGGGWGDGYLFYYRISGYWSLYKFQCGTSTTLVYSKESPKINTGESWNTLKVRVNNGVIDIYINDSLHGSYYDDLLEKGKVGLYTAAQYAGAKAKFDNITLTEIPKTIISGKGSGIIGGKPNSLKDNILLSSLEEKSIKSFQSYKIYRNNILIHTTNDTSYIDPLLSYGEYEYEVLASYPDGLSNPSNAKSLTYTGISTDVDSLDFGMLTIGESFSLPFTIYNYGNSNIYGQITTPDGFMVNNTKNALNYSILPNSSKTYTLTFTPAISQLYMEQIVISHNSFGSDKKINVKGRAVIELPHITSFEKGLGGWDQDREDDFDWTRHYLKTDDYDTGPHTAYDDNYYLYTEASYFGYPQKQFGLIAHHNCENVSKPYLSFWYNMRGNTMGTLKVQVSTNKGVDWEDAWSISGNQGTGWNPAEIDLITYANEKFLSVKFLGITGDSVNSDMAIDLVELYNDFNAPENLIADYNPISGQVDLSWGYEEETGFQYFNVYKDSNIIYTTTDTVFSEVVYAFGNYEYKVTAYYGGDESSPTNVETVNVYENPALSLSANLEESIGVVNLDWEMGGEEYGYNIYEYFNDEIADNWNTIGGEWEIIDSVYQVSESKGYESAYYVEDFHNIEYEVKMRRDSSSQYKIGIYFNGDVTPANYYWNNGYLFQYKNGGYWSLVRIKENSSVDLQDWTFSSAIVGGVGGWNVLKVVAVNGTIEVFINGKLQGVFFDDTFQSGKVGLFHGGNIVGHAKYDYVTLKEVSGDSKAFQHFDIYRNSSYIGLSTNTSYLDTLPDYGAYNYTVKAVYNEGESVLSNEASVLWEYSDFYINPTFISSDLAVGDTITKPMEIINNGDVSMNYSVRIEYDYSKGGAKLSIPEVEGLIRNRYLNLKKALTDTSEAQKMPDPEEIINTEYYNTKSNLSVALLGAEDYSSYLYDVRNKLNNTGKFSSITTINVNYNTPTVDELLAFDAVLVWQKAPYQNKYVLGDNLADYVDNGGGVVSALFEVSSGNTSYSLDGRWEDDEYFVLERGNVYNYSISLGYYNHLHPIMNSVNSLEAMKISLENDITGGSVVARWSYSSGTVAAVKDIGNMHRVDLGFYPASTDVSSSGWDSSTDGAILMANSLEWVADDIFEWLDVNPKSGAIEGNESLNLDVKFNANDIELGTYNANIIVTNSTKLETVVPITLNVLHPISVHAFTFLEGPFFGTQMIPLLNAYQYIPLNQPYSGSPWNYNGTESVDSIPNANVIDWVLVEIRETAGDVSSATESTIIGRRAGFLLKNGRIVDIDGNSFVDFPTVASKDLYVVVYHRNHTAIISSNPMSHAYSVYQYNFTTGESQAYGGASAQTEIFMGVWGMFSGNANSDKQIDNKDKNDVWEVENGNSGYYNGDMNMNGKVDDADEKINWENNAGKSSKVPE